MRLRSMLIGSAMLSLLAGCAGGPTDSASQESIEPAVATYQGSLPCRNCDGIGLDVELTGEEADAMKDRTFTLTASYMNHPQNPPDEDYAGNWEVLSGTPSDPGATVYELTPNNEGQTYYFLRMNESTLELIDPERRRFENGEKLRLKRQ